MAAEEDFQQGLKKNAPFKTWSFQKDKNEALEKVPLSLQEDGVVVIEDVFDHNECTNYCDEIANCLGRICPKLDPTPSGGRTWISSHLPPGPRAGLMQGWVGNLAPVWDIRSHPRIREIFTTAYSGLRGYEVNDFFSSIDGINVRPHVAPYHVGEVEKKGEYTDWAHLDQTTRQQPYWCIQGQVVLTNTTACFRASPKSHTIYDKLLDIANNHSKSGWCKFTAGQVPEVKKAIEEVGGTWQTPVRTKRGSVILWLSSTVHSAMTQQRNPVVVGEEEGDEKWRDWRFVVYTSYRPKAECEGSHANRLKMCMRDNTCTNHSGQKTFGKKVTRGKPQYDAHMARYYNDPAQIYRFMPLNETKAIKELTSH